MSNITYYVAALSIFISLNVLYVLWRSLRNLTKKETSGLARKKADLPVEKPFSIMSFIRPQVKEPVVEEGETETDGEIDQRIKDRFQILAHLVDEVIRNALRSLIIVGPAGLGKSFALEEALIKADPEKKRHGIVKGYVRPTGLYRMLWKHRHEDNILIFDDTDSVFNDETSLNLLKAVLDTTDERVVSYMSERRLKDDDTGELIPKQFTFSATIVFISNLDFDAIIAAEKSKLVPHFKAMISRSHYIDMDMRTDREYIIRIKQVMSLGLLKKKGLNIAEENDVMAFIERNAHKMRELSLRSAIKVAELRKGGQKDWAKVAKATLCVK